MPNYLKEAFKELELLNEETFSFDKDGAAELKKFYDGDTTDDYESIIDPEAETKDELEDSYEGKVIVACKICHGMQYKDPQDIVIDEESDYVNVGEECPACSAVDGYKIVGQVAPYCAECDEMDESASKLEESTWNFNITRMPKVAASKLDKIESSGLWDDFLDEMDDNTESIRVHTDEYRIVKGTSDEVVAHDKKIMWDLINKYYDKALKKSKGESLSESYDESLNENRKARLVIESLKSAPKRHFKESLNEEKLTTLFDVVGGMLDGTMDRITINKKTGKKQAVGTKTPYDASEDIGVDDDGYFVWVADEAGAKYAQEVADKFGLKTKLDAPTKYIKDSKNRKFHIYIPEGRYDETVEQAVEESCDRLKEGYDRDILIHDILSKLEQEGYDVRGRDARTYADGAAELIMIAPDGYTVDKWFEDTKMNHPEDLLRFKKFSDLKESGAKNNARRRKNVKSKIKEALDKTVFTDELLNRVKKEIKSGKRSDATVDVIEQVASEGIQGFFGDVDVEANVQAGRGDYRVYDDEGGYQYWYAEEDEEALDDAILNANTWDDAVADYVDFLDSAVMYHEPDYDDDDEEYDDDEEIKPRIVSEESYQAFIKLLDKYLDNEIESEIVEHQRMYHWVPDDKVMLVYAMKNVFSKLPISTQRELVPNLDHVAYAEMINLLKPEDLKRYIDKVRTIKRRLGNSIVESQSEKKSKIRKHAIKESVKNVKVETDSDTVTVTPTEGGDVKVETQSKKTIEPEAETIVPVDDETKDEIDMNDANFDETDVDIDIDSIDDEGFDALGESYLKKVYENVKSFKTSNSSIKDGKLMVEGIISFNSGKKAKTSFVFESISKTKRGKIKFLGKNPNFSKSKSAFTLIAKPEGKKAVCESLTYNYVAKDSKSNKKLPVYGKVSK